MNINKIRELFENSENKYTDAEKIGITYEAMRRILNGGDLKVSTLEKIAKFYEKPIGYFFDEPMQQKKRERQGAKQLEIERLKGQLKGMREAIDRLGFRLEGVIIEDDPAYSEG